MWTELLAELDRREHERVDRVQRSGWFRVDYGTVVDDMIDTAGTMLSGVILAGLALAAFHFLHL